MILKVACATLLAIGLSAAAQVSPSSSAAAAAWKVKGTPEVVSEDVRFNNGEVSLSGTVYLPKTGQNLPGIVVLHSAMADTRQAGLYKHLKEALPALGFAVLIYDRRGSGASSGSLQNISYETLADDGIAGLRCLAQFPRVDARKIGFWGLSQGGWLAVLAAGRAENAAFAVSISAPLVTAEEQMRFAMRNLLALRGYSGADIQEMLNARKVWTGYLRGTNTRAQAVELLRKAQSKPWFSIAYLPAPSKLTKDPENDSYRKEMDDDPVAAVEKAKVPLLFLYGDSDPWIPVAESVARLESLSAKMPNIEYRVLQGTNHEMMFAGQETMQVDAETIRKDSPQVPAYFMVLASWLSRQAPSR